MTRTYPCPPQRQFLLPKKLVVVRRSHLSRFAPNDSATIGVGAYAEVGLVDTLRYTLTDSGKKKKEKKEKSKGIFVSAETIVRRIQKQVNRSVRDFKQVRPPVKFR